MPAFFIGLALLLSAYLKDETVSGYAGGSEAFRLIEIDGAPFAARATLAFPREGVVEGAAPCNQYSARQMVPYPWFEIQDLRATRAACPHLSDEQAFFGALDEMSLIEIFGDTIVLTNDAGREMVFQRLPE